MIAAGDLGHYIPVIVERLRLLNPAKIIVFGSYVWGNPTVDSDLDVLVVTSSEQLPQSYADKEAIYLEVARVLRDIRAQISLDLVVYTRPMYEQFIALESLFAREILQKGQVVYESNHASLV